MSPISTRLRRRITAVAAAGVLAVGGLAFTATPAQAAEETIDNATFKWGLSGYAQDGIFGPWNFKSFTGDAAFLEGSVVDSPLNPTPQTEYVVDPLPATSFPTSKTGRAANAVKLTGGDGTIDRVTGEADLEWVGSYTVNAYPAMYNAPDEIYKDPHLTVEADGSGELTMEFTIGAGVDQGGAPFPAENFGRLKIATFDAGSLSAKTIRGFRVTPDFQGVNNGLAGQTTNCVLPNAWGSWPVEYINALNSNVAGQSVLGHFHTTGCGGKQDNKAPLPFDIGLPTTQGSVEISQSVFDAAGTQTVTVTGTGFDPDYAAGNTQPPFAGKSSGVYVAFGRFQDVWDPAAGNAGTTRALADSTTNRNGVSVKWAVPAASFPGSPAQDPDAPSYTVLNPDGSFTATLQINKSWITAETGNWGIYTYRGGNAAVTEYATYTPIAFNFATSTTATGLPAEAEFGDALTANVAVAGDGGTATGAVEAFDGDAKIAEGELTEGVAAIALPDLAAGTHELTFRYEGDSTNRTSTSEVHELTVAAAETSTTVTGLPDTAVLGAELTANVAVTGNGGAVTGTVEAFDGDDKIAEGELAEGAAAIELPTDLAVGTHDLTFAYEGDANNEASTSEAHELTVTAAPVVKVNSAPSVSVPASTYGKTSTITVNVPTVGATAPTGDVTLSGAVAQTATLANGTATFALPATLTAGSSALTASYSGDANYNASSSASTLVIAKAKVKASDKVTKRPTSKAKGKATITVKSKTSGTPTGKITVTFKKKGKSTKKVTKTLSSGTGKINIPKLAKGTWKIYVKYNGSTNFDKTGATYVGTVKVKK